VHAPDGYSASADSHCHEIELLFSFHFHFMTDSILLAEGGGGVRPEERETDRSNNIGNFPFLNQLFANAIAAAVATAAAPTARHLRDSSRASHLEKWTLVGSTLVLCGTERGLESLLKVARSGNGLGPGTRRKGLSVRCGSCLSLLSFEMRRGEERAAHRRGLHDLHLTVPRRGRILDYCQSRGLIF
jgi:hypothetical protein